MTDTLAGRGAKPFVVGTTGWSAEDFADPEFVRRWEAGRYEIVEGVLTAMPPSAFFGNSRLHDLLFILNAHTRSAGAGGRFAQDADIVLTHGRVVRADAVYLSPADLAAQDAAVAREGVPPERARLYVPPTLVIESVSEGHEAHDRRTKRAWYAEFGVPHYWIFDPAARRLECLVLDGRAYRVEADAAGDAEVRPTAFPGLTVKLAEVWAG